MSFSFDFADTPQDSGCFSSVSFDNSIINSTPVTHKKNLKRKYEDTLELSATPPFSSTLNDESLVRPFRKLELGANTPKKQMICHQNESHTSHTASPLEESRKLIYSEGLRYRPSIKKTSSSPSPFKANRTKRYQNKSTAVLLKQITSNQIIMRNIFKYLSDGCLYRLSETSMIFRRAIHSDYKAFERLSYYREIYKQNKENYLIPTPPSSPEKCDSPPRNNNASETFNLFVRTGRRLKSTQSQVPCPKCTRPCMVDNNIGQCSNFALCGYIYCLKCWSYSTTGADNFVDKCGGAILKNLTNNKTEDLMYSNTLSSFLKHDSGFGSELETPPVVKEVVRRKLFPSGDKPLAVNNNRQITFKTVEKRRDIINSFVEVIPSSVNNSNKRRGVNLKRDSPPNSPPKCDYVAGSKKSKNNLKRLTF